MSIQERLLEDSNLAFHIRALQVDSDQLGRMAKAINAATPGFKSVMGSECDHAEVALTHLIEERDALLAVANAAEALHSANQREAGVVAMGCYWSALEDALNAWRAVK